MQNPTHVACKAEGYKQGALRCLACKAYTVRASQIGTSTPLLGAQLEGD